MINKISTGNGGDEETKTVARKVNIHLVSDSTGKPVTTVSRACLVQFNHLRASEFV